MSTLTRAETPTQSPVGELYWLGVLARVDGSTLASRPLVWQVLNGRRVLGVDHVGRRAAPFGDDLVGQGVLVVAADVDGDPGGLLEPGHQRVGGLHVLAAVEGDRAGARGRAATGGQHPAGQGQDQGQGDGLRVPPSRPDRPSVPSGPLRSHLALLGSPNTHCQVPLMRWSSPRHGRVYRSDRHGGPGRSGVIRSLRSPSLPQSAQVPAPTRRSYTEERDLTSGEAGCTSGTRPAEMH